MPRAKATPKHSADTLRSNMDAAGSKHVVLGPEFSTPSCILRSPTKEPKPYHGGILHPACGSSGVFVSFFYRLLPHAR